MPLRCLLFSPDEETVRTIGQVLNDLGLEAESCFRAVEAVEKISIRPFQVVIIDWGSQPEAGFLLKTARERKPADRPLTLAIVSDDASVPTALQAGANSVLRRPLQITQVRDTLATARDFLRSKAEAPAHAAATAAAAANTAAIAAANTAAAAELLPTEVQSTLRAGEFLQPSGSVPATLFETESEVQKSLDQAAAAEIDPLKELEPTAGSVLKQSSTRTRPAAANDDDSDRPRGLAWYLKSRVSPLPATLHPLPKPETEEPETEKPETPRAAEQLLGYEQTSSVIEKSSASTASQEPESRPAESIAPRINSLSAAHRQQEEAELFAYITGEKSADTEEDETPSQLRPWLVKGAMAIAAVVVIAVIYTAPQTGVQKKLQSTVGSASRAGNNWLNPQPATTPQAPASHENFGRAGDEYQLPIAENIPDKNTDPAQIRVLPVIDPTVKQPNNGTPPPDQGLTPVAPVTPGIVDPADPSQAGADSIPTGTNQTGATPDGQPQPTNAQQTNDPASLPAATAAQNLPRELQPAAATHPATSAAADPFRPNPSTEAHPPITLPRPVVHARPSGPVAPAVHTVSTAIPSSLQSSIAQMSPQASGNKPIEAAMASIEPVDLPEAAARALLLDHAEPAYPPSAHGQAGSVVVQLLIGRDGTVKDAKFVQGSLAFARPAIDAVRQWHFKPYLMNGRPAATQTQFTLNFKPTS
jgi:TonB family protein